MDELAYDPFDAAVLENPYPTYARLREEAPCYHVPNTDIWAVSRYSDVQAVLRNHAVFSSAGGVGPDWEPRPMMSMYDPPEHTRLRRIVARHFTPKYLTSFAPSMEANAQRLMTSLVERGTSDIVQDFAEPLVAALIADVLGIPEEERDDFRRWSLGTVSMLAKGLPKAEADRAEATRREFVAYLKRVTSERRSVARVGPTDIVSLLLDANDSERLTASESIAFCILLLVAGFETTVNAIVNCANAVAHAPGVWSTVRKAPELLNGMIEEGLRYDSPDQSFFRNTVTDVEIAGTVIPARSKVMVLFGAANRDPAKYPDPDVFDVRRNPNDHLAFGGGIHYCIGAPLARLQLGIVSRVALRKIRSMEPAGDYVRAANVITRGFRKLPVTITAV